MIRVFLAGEGRHELGGWAGHPNYRQPAEPGVLEALLRRCRPDGWQVADAREWKALPKFRAGEHRRPEHRTVRGLAALAARDCQVLAFVRDTDGYDDRAREIEAAVAEVLADGHVAVIGGVAARSLDAWCLALLGHRGTESLRRPKERLEEIGCASLSERVALVERADLGSLPDDAVTLRRWLDRARAVLGGAP